MNPVAVITPIYREKQYLLPKVEKLKVALDYIKARIDGMVNILKYYEKPVPKLPHPPRPSRDPEAFEREIRVWEAKTSNALWDELVKLIRPKEYLKLKYDYGFSGRKPGHPDPFNKSLSVMYSVLYTLSTRALIAAGLDPTYGFLHRTRYSVPLTFDYSEMFKPIAIQATIEMVNQYGLPELDEDGELKREGVGLAIRVLYEYLSLKHIKTKRSPYHNVFLKATCLAKYLLSNCKEKDLVFVWNRKMYKKPS